MRTNHLASAIAFTALFTANGLAQQASNKSSFDRTAIPKAGADPESFI